MEVVVCVDMTNGLNRSGLGSKHFRDVDIFVSEPFAFKRNVQILHCCDWAVSLFDPSFKTVE
eukprot:scaffold1119_cov120-Cylindrotheca_fusiformis.AAC.16